MTDPNLDVQGCGMGPDPEIFDGGGGVYQLFEGGVALRGLEAVGRQGDSSGPAGIALQADV